MDLFEYVGVLVSIVVGLALAHILTGVTRTLQAHGQVRLYWVHSLWTLNIMVYLVFFWWFMYHWSQVESWNFFLFVFLLLYAVALYLISALLFPGEIPPGFDFKKHYFRTNRWVFGFLTAAYVLDVFETTSKAVLDIKEIPMLWYPVVIPCAIGSAVATLTRNERFHKIFAPVWLVLLLVFILFARRVQTEAGL
jgi:hypothetical protein